jgi:nicotinate-nucleotide adenylyltransferase
MRLGVFGGSFDPVHVGHLIVAEAAADQLKLDRVLFVPALVQPFKVGQHSAPATDRVAMLELAIAGNPRFLLDHREIERDAPSYTVDTLRELGSEIPRDELFLLVGADTAWDLPRWHDAEVLSQFANLVVLSRPGYGIPDFAMIARSLDVPAISLSATHIRESVRRGDSLRYLVPDAVAEYIVSNCLYGSTALC